MTIAVVGSGVSGLAAAHLLSQEHEVVLFEASTRLGGHVNTVTVDSHGRDVPVDTGFIVFNRRNYPLFSRLLDELGVESQLSKMSFSVQVEADGTEYSGSNLGSLFATRRNLGRKEHWSLLAEIARFVRWSPRLAQAPPEETLEVLTERYSFSQSFMERFLLPLCSALWSCPASTSTQVPIRFVCRFLENHSMLRPVGRPKWRTVRHGAQRYVDALCERLKAEVRVGRPVERVRRSEHGVIVECGTSYRFDEAVLACHADQALNLVAQPSESESALLGAFPYQPNVALLHTDTRLLPRNPQAWSSWNYRVPMQPESVPTVTYNMNILQSLDTPETYCVSLNEQSRVAPDKVVAQIEYEHPVMTVRGLLAQEQRTELIRHQGLSYCGAYWGYGFHEDGFRSGVEVARAFGVEG